MLTFAFIPKPVITPNGYAGRHYQLLRELCNRSFLTIQTKFIDFITIGVPGHDLFIFRLVKTIPKKICGIL